MKSELNLVKLLQSSADLSPKIRDVYDLCNYCSVRILYLTCTLKSISMRMQFVNSLILLSISLLVFTFSAMSQQTIKNYSNEWKKVDDAVKKSLPQSALAEVNKIYALAKKENQEAQIIKSLIYIIYIATY